MDRITSVPGTSPAPGRSAAPIAPPSPEAAGPLDVVVLPAQAGSADEARQKMAEARTLLGRLGGSVGRDLKAAGGFTARLSPEQKQALQEAGFQVVQDRKVDLLPPRPSIGLQPGFLLDPKALDVASRTLAGLETGPDAAVGPAPDAALSPAAGDSTLGFFPDFGGFGERPYPPGFNPFPWQSVQVRGHEGPADLVGPLPTTGKGVTIAIIDSGLYPHPDLADRVIGFASAVDRSGRPNDPMGHGTHVAGDAAGSGRASGGRYRGPAPEANLVGIQVLGADDGEMNLSNAIENVVSGIDWMVENKDRYNIRVANVSLGLPLLQVDRGWFGPTTLYDPIGAAINRAVEAGIAVVAAAGNSGSDPGTIAESPAINDNVITVGALDTQGTPADRRDDHVAEFSSRGPTPDGRVKPDILAPGVNIMAPNAPGGLIEQQNEQMALIREKIETLPPRQLQHLALQLAQAGMIPPQVLRLPIEELRELLLEGMKTHATEGELRGRPAYMAMDGTSMASPIVAGVVAAMLEANPALSPQEVKEILRQTADKLPGVRSTDQGAGVLDAREAVEVAARLRGRGPAYG